MHPVYSDTSSNVWDGEHFTPGHSYQMVHYDFEPCKRLATSSVFAAPNDAGCLPCIDLLYVQLSETSAFFLSSVGLILVVGDPCPFISNSCDEVFSVYPSPNSFNLLLAACVLSKINVCADWRANWDNSFGYDISNWCTDGRTLTVYFDPAMAADPAKLNYIRLYKKSRCDSIQGTAV